jgi:Na+/H+ antiporter NhaD/arsenite permease-like protein
LIPVWWSLALGACLGGNGTAICASANVIVIGLSEKASNKISFIKFMAYGMPIIIITVAISTVYVWIRYYVIKI